MIVYELNESNSVPEINKKIFCFEQLFDYPFDHSKRFKIDHSPDYSTFYRSIGESKTIIVESDACIIATISIAVRNICIKNIEKQYIYIGDLKIHPHFRSSTLLFKLAQHVQKIVQASNIHAYGIVMDGTAVTPEQYSGRLGIPLFQSVTKVCILRFNTNMLTKDEKENEKISNQNGYDLYRRLNKESTLLTLSDPNIRSILDPTWFQIESKACGMLEDTRKAKKLFLTSGEEIISAHLSYFSFLDAESAIQILQSAILYARKQGYPAVFVGLSMSQLEILKDQLPLFSYEYLSATLYATNPICAHITINTADI